MKPKHFIAIIGSVLLVVGVLFGLQKRPADCGTVYLPSDEGMAKDGSLHVCMNFDPVLFTTAWVLTVVGILVIIGALFVRWKKSPPTPPTNWPNQPNQQNPPPSGWH